MSIMDLTGKFLAFEGPDGSGKALQTRLFIKKLEALGYDVASFAFPCYGHPSAFFVERYLRGEYGDHNSVLPVVASMFFALNRYEFKESIENALLSGKVVVSDRFTSSNLGHQGSKFRTMAERVIFYEWLRDLEYGKMRTPKPNLNIILNVPPRISQMLVEKKAEREYLHGEKKDVLEGDSGHVESATEVYLELSRVYPEEFVVVNCMKEDELLPPEVIHHFVWEAVKSRFTK